MTEITKFKVGDKVRYKESEKKNAKYNGHDFNEIYTVSSFGSDTMVFFVESPDQGCYKHRLELAPGFQEETFDYKQALKILAENPETNIQMLSGDFWVSIRLSGSIVMRTNNTSEYRIAPEDKPKYYFVIKSKGKFAVTSQKYTCEEDVKAAYSYPVKVIQKLED